MTYYKRVPDKVFKRWMALNPNYEIDFSLDNECITFLEHHFNKYVSNLFISIKKGMFKADLWRICKLYINGGIYADVDLVPYLNINILNRDISFYSCLDHNRTALFQAFILSFSKPKNPLFLIFILSFLLNNPYTYNNGPCHDMAKCLRYNMV